MTIRALRAGTMRGDRRFCEILRTSLKLAWILYWSIRDGPVWPLDVAVAPNIQSAQKVANFLTNVKEERVVDIVILYLVFFY